MMERSNSNVPSRSPKYFEYLDFSANSSSTTKSLFPEELRALTAPRKASKRKERNHLIVVLVYESPQDHDLELLVYAVV